MLTEKAPAEKLDDNNQKIIQKCFGRYLYYDRAVDPAMLMELKSLAEVHTKAKIKTAKQLTQFLNYSEKQFGRSIRIQMKHNNAPYLFGCILHLRSRGTKQSWSIFFLGQKCNTPIKSTR